MIKFHTCLIESFSASLLRFDRASYFVSVFFAAGLGGLGIFERELLLALLILVIFMPPLLIVSRSLSGDICLLTEFLRRVTLVIFAN